MVEVLPYIEKKYNFVFIWCSLITLVQITISCSVTRRSSLQIGFIMNTINNHNSLHKAATITGIFLLWGALKWFRNSWVMNIMFEDVEENQIIISKVLISELL